LQRKNAKRADPRSRRHCSLIAAVHRHHNNKSNLYDDALTQLCRTRRTVSHGHGPSETVVKFPPLLTSSPQCSAAAASQHAIRHSTPDPTTMLHRRCGRQFGRMALIADLTVYSRACYWSSDTASACFRFIRRQSFASEHG